MAHGSLNATDLRIERNFLGNIASAIGNRIGKSSNMARKERAFASKKAEDGGTSLEEAGIGKGYFFKRALGSSFGGDRIARTRGRFESDPGPGRDPTGSQASRFRGGFGYDVTNEIFGSAGAAALSGGGLGAGGGVAQKHYDFLTFQRNYHGSLMRSPPKATNNNGNHESSKNSYGIHKTFKKSSKTFPEFGLRVGVLTCYLRIDLFTQDFLSPLSMHNCSRGFVCACVHAPRLAQACICGFCMHACMH